MAPLSLSTVINERLALKFPLYSLMGISFWGIGTAKRVPAITYSVFSVTKEELWFHALLGISMISAVSKVVRSTRATRGVLLPFINIHRPSSTPLVCDISGWCVSSQGIKPKVVFNIGLVSSL